MRKTKEAFHWIIKILKKHKVPFHITGGFAAKIYGSQRPLNDIDIDIPDAKMNTIMPEIKKYIINKGKYKTKAWKALVDITLKYKGQIIDITGTTTEKIYDSKKRKWVHGPKNFSTDEKRKVFELTVPVISKKELLSYKIKLLEVSFRKHQIIDVETLLSLKHQQPKSF